MNDSSRAVGRMGADWRIEGGCIVNGSGEEILVGVGGEAAAAFVLKCVKDYISSERGSIIVSNNVAMPRKDSLLRSIESAVRKSRRDVSDRALFDVALRGEYSGCVVHGGCGVDEVNEDYTLCRDSFDGRSLNVYGASFNGGGAGRSSEREGRSKCNWALLGVDMILSDGTTYRISLDVVSP